MKWVTRSSVHVDRVACPWLIKRFVDSRAEFLFVARSQIDDIVQNEGAIPFDCPDAELGHHGDECSFDAILKMYELHDEALELMAVIVRGADTRRPELHPVSAGLGAIAGGFRIRYPDDHENIANQFAVYDALYAWCRLQTAKGK